MAGRIIFSKPEALLSFLRRSDLPRCAIEIYLNLLQLNCFCSPLLHVSIFTDVVVICTSIYGTLTDDSS